MLYTLSFQLYNCSDGKAGKVLVQGSRSGLPITCLNFHPTQSKGLFSAGSDGRISMYNVETAARTYTTTGKSIFAQKVVK